MCFYFVDGICHNEDGSLLDFDRTALLDVSLTLSSGIALFTAWCYVGQLPTAGNQDLIR